MSYHNLLSKNDRALMAYIISKGVTASVVPAKSSLDKTAPLVACWSERGMEVAPYSGTYHLTVSIQVKTIGAVDAGEAANAARLANESLVSQVFDLFHLDISSGGAPMSGDILGANITAAARALAASDPANHADLADYTCEQVIIKGPEAGFEEDVWVDTLNLEMVACPANVS